MPVFLLTRIFQAALAVFAATVLVFFMARVSGDPVAMLLRDTASRETVAALRSELGLDRPLPEQYWRFLANGLQGDFGESLRYRVPALELILQRLPATIMLAAAAFGLALLVAIPAGLFAAAHQNGLIDRVVRLLAASGQAMPTFLLGLLLIIVFAVQLDWFPTSGAGTWSHLVLPAATLATFSVSGLARLTRSAALETLRTEYIKFARAKGVSERRVLWRHVLPNASLSILTFGGLVLLNLLSGAVIVETVFAWPGVGSTIVEAARSRDFPLIQAATVLLVAAYVGVNLLVDVCYGLLNPRLRVAT